MSRLETEGLTVRRSGKVIVDRISLSFAPGDFVAVIGANGAGKSTFLTALAGISRPEGGSVRLDGQLLSAIDAKALARRRAYLPQSPRAEWPISVERLIALGLTPQLPAFGGLPADVQPRIDAMIAACDLETHRDQPATTLSGGELARAMLARALVGDPDILIADEPIAGLDPRHALDTVARLHALAKAGKLVIASIHDLTFVARYATRVVAIHHGRVAADGPTAEVLTSGLLRHLFDVEACVSGTGEGAYVDFVAPAPKVRPVR
jgi:iron complex transport system ATP-binding protein